MKHPMISALIVAASLFSACQQAAEPHPVIVAHVDAFNARDFDAMSSVEHPEIEWIRVLESDVRVDISGRDTLAKILRDYTASTPDVAGALRDWSINGDYVSVTETATWTATDGSRKAQSTLTVYQLEDGLIRRVWYYPSVPQ
ncbi:hypothetical protein GCM10007853_05850 [Algimonas ampicilliniresistens]|jgi:hypothetical protein|uniref:SnoaL-like domain-containing protein n=1 Tax=Algimonas ampicilliniresistens TaxID=1298735 RepID=A0ABQ5V587_9PROT|nr:nuclear transport factor 2 family protein [Algimonas ampicilliniresistens]GLQ22711.1 hypothetical protein GCM10007853_05850 [Algimonas ampicilliniresistens]